MNDILEALGLRQEKTSRDTASLVRSVPHREKSLEHDIFVPERMGESDGDSGCVYEIRKNLSPDEYAEQQRFLEENLPPFLHQKTGEEYSVVTNHPISIPVSYGSSAMRKTDLLVMPENAANDADYMDAAAGISLDYQNIRVQEDELQPYLDEFADQWDTYLDETLPDKREDDVYVR